MGDGATANLPYAGNETYDGSLGDRAKEMRMAAARGEWREVAKIYAATEAVRVAPIIQTGDTVLHLAVSSRVESNVKLLMGSIPETCSGEILEMANKSGDTPLHLAAALGMREACQDMARRCPELVTKARNKHGETPLFKAVLHGRKEAFHAMRDATQRACNSRDLDFLPNSVGDTILHVALLHEHLDLALEIVRCYPTLANQCDKKGEFPIHILANMPSIFKSRFDFKNPLDELIYNWISVDPPERDVSVNNGENDGRNLSDGNLTPPDVSWVRKTSRTIGHGIRRRPIPNEEDPASLAENREAERRQANQNNSERQKKNFSNVWRRFQKYCDVFVTGLALAIPTIFVLRKKVIEMKKLKKMHVRAPQIMIKLLEHRPEWDFGEAGRHPSNIRSDWFKLSPEPPEAAAVDDSLPPEESDGSPEGGLKEEKQLEDWAESPILLAAKNGITELVGYVLERCPIALFDLDSNGRNIILLAAEHRQYYIYELMLKRVEMQQSVFGIVDKDGNSAAHLAAKLAPDQPQFIRLAVFRMKREIGWFKHVERSMDPGFFPRYNKDGLTAQEIFTETHKDLLREAGEQLAKTYQSWAMVAALIVANAASAAGTSLSTSVVGENPSLWQDRRSIFSFSAFIFSGLSLWLFLNFVTCGYEQWDFETSLTWKLRLYILCIICSIMATVGAAVCAWTVHLAFLPHTLLRIILFGTCLCGFQLVRAIRDAIRAERAPLPGRSLD